MRWFLGPTICLAILAFACGGKSPASRAVGDGAPCTNDATATAVVSINSTARASGTADLRRTFDLADTEVECRLRPALLRSDDLSGWEEDRSQGLDPAHVREQLRGQPFDPIAMCGAPANSFLGGLSAVFQRVGGDSLVAERVIAFEPGNAARFMQGLRRNCALKLAGASNHSTQTVYAPVPAMSLGDESYGVSVSMDLSAGGGSDPVPEHAIFLRRGDVVVMVELIYPEVSGTSVQVLAAQIDERLASVRAMPEPTAVAGEGCFPPSTPTPGASNERLQAALLQLDDMPESWGPHLVTKCGLIDGEGACKNAGNEPPEPTAVVSTAFDRTQSFLREDIELWSDRSAADEVQRIPDRLSVPFECDATIGSTDFKWQLAIVDLPGLPEGAVATRLRTIGLGSGHEVLIYGVAFARGDLVARLLFAPPHDLFLMDADSGRDISPGMKGLLGDWFTPIVQIAERELNAAAAH